MRRSGLSNVASLPAVRLLRAVPLAAGLALAGAVIPAGAAAALPSNCAQSGATVTCTFSYTGAAQTFTVPAGVQSIAVTADGAAGGASDGFGSPHQAGGLGAQVLGTLAVTPGAVLQVNVGGQGGTDGYEAGGFNGGGYGGNDGTGGVDSVAGGGGGASDIRDGSDSLTDRLLVGGGGGGGGGNGENFPSTETGGAGGGSSSDGTNGTSDTAAPGGSKGLAGTQSGGGSGGAGSRSGGGGSLGDGGNGGGSNAPGGDGGGGGGGYYGGGAGGAGAANPETAGGGGGGGGGSDYTGAATNVTVTDGMQSGNGQVTISYNLLSVTTTSLPGGVVGTAYGPSTLAATGGITPYAWVITAPRLPPGLSIDSSTGVISGTPTAYGTFGFTVMVIDAENPAMTASKALSIVVKPAPLVITTTSLPAATGGHPYSATVAATGGIPPYSWSVTAGSLPPVLKLNASTGVISGIPDVAGTYSFTVTVTDSESPVMKASKTLSITVSGPVVTVLSPDHGSEFGAAVRIRGTGLACPPGSRSCRVSVSFGSNPALVVVSVTPTEIAVVAPEGTGTVTVTVTVGGVRSEATAATEFTYEFGFGLSRFLP